jgi:hypothetical protein
LLNILDIFDKRMRIIRQLKVIAWKCINSKKPSICCEGWFSLLRQHPDLNWGMEVLQTSELILEPFALTGLVWHSD